MNTDETSQRWSYDIKGRQTGPVATDVIRDLLHRGTVSHETLVWNETFGQSWKPIRDTDIIISDKNTPPPLPATHVNNTCAWLLVLVPVVGVFGEKAVGDLGVRPSQVELVLAYAVVNAAIALVDAKHIARSGRNANNISLGFWFWLIPAYLFQRARALRQSFAYFWAWIVSFAAAIFISSPDILSGNTYWGTGIPVCNSSFAINQVKTIFKDIAMMRLAAINALDVRDSSETSLTGSIRTCRASVLASNAMTYNISYTIELRGEQIFTNVNIIP
jgi:GYF domain 2